MIAQIAKLHVEALPHTSSSKRGVRHVSVLYNIVSKIGHIKVVKREGKIVGALSSLGRFILTLVIHPTWQRQGIGKELINQLSGTYWVYTEQCSVGFYEKMGFVKKFEIGKIIFLCRK